MRKGEFPRHNNTVISSRAVRDYMPLYQSNQACPTTTTSHRPGALPCLHILLESVQSKYLLLCRGITKYDKCPRPPSSTVNRRIRCRRESVSLALDLHPSSSPLYQQPPLPTEATQHNTPPCHAIPSRRSISLSLHIHHIPLLVQYSAQVEIAFTKLPCMDRQAGFDIRS